MSEKIMKDIRNTFTCPAKCEHDFQDKRYGKGSRIFTITTKDSKKGKRCSACGTFISG
jgi:hypothetical protein